MATRVPVARQRSRRALAGKPCALLRHARAGGSRRSAEADPVDPPGSGSRRAALASGPCRPGARSALRCSLQLALRGSAAAAEGSMRRTLLTLGMSVLAIPTGGILVSCGGDAMSGVPDNVPNHPTYHEHVAPILARACVSCHTAGGIAPFALDSYDAARTA